MEGERLVSEGGGGMQQGWPSKPPRKRRNWKGIVGALILALAFLLLLYSITKGEKPIAQTVRDLGVLVERDDPMGGALLIQASVSFELNKVRQAHDAVKAINDLELKKRGEGGR